MNSHKIKKVTYKITQNKDSHSKIKECGNRTTDEIKSSSDITQNPFSSISSFELHDGIVVFKGHG